MRDSNSAAELQNDQYQSDAESVLQEIEEQLLQEAEAMIGSAQGMYELFSDCEPDVVPNLVSILSTGKRPGDLMNAVDKMSGYLLDLAKNMLREKVTQRVMEDRQSIECGYEG